MAGRGVKVQQLCSLFSKLVRVWLARNLILIYRKFNFFGKANSLGMQLWVILTEGNIISIYMSEGQYEKHTVATYS